MDQVFHGGSGNRVQRGTGLVHQNDFRLDRYGPGDTEPLLLAAAHAGTGFSQPVLNLIPQAGLLEGGLDDLIKLSPAVNQAMNAGPVGNIIVNGFGKGIGFLEDHPHLGPQGDHINGFVVDILPIQHHLPRDPAAVHRVIHPVQTAQKSRLATTGRSDHGQHLVAADIYGYIFDGMVIAVIDIDITTRHARVIDKLLTDRAPVFTADFFSAVFFNRLVHLLKDGKCSPSTLKDRLDSSHYSCSPENKPERFPVPVIQRTVELS